MVRLEVQDEAQAVEAQAQAQGPVVEAEVQVQLRMRNHQSARPQQAQEELGEVQALEWAPSRAQPKSED